MNTALQDSNLKIHRLPEVQVLTGLPRSTIYRRIEEGTFPKSISLGPRSVGWLHEDIQKWIADRVIASSISQL